MDGKVFNDIVHGHMEFHPLIVSIIDTPQFQRLRYLKQIGPCYLVFPTAVHSRFEHSLGTAFLAGKLMNALNRKRGFFGEEAKKETLSVQIAGLCHDLGHGPFSHTWEHFLTRCKKNWKHEEYSVEIFRRILKETVPDRNEVGDYVTIRELFKKYGLEDFIEEIEIMIKGDKRMFIEKKYLYQIVCNKTNGVDVDKWDYLMRDGKMASVPVNFNCDRIFPFCQILKDDDGCEQICFREKECSILLDMFLTRGLYHDKIYQHRKVKIIEEMLIDAFCLADKSLNLSTEDVDSFLKLTDHIYQKILYEDFEGVASMEEAKTILRKLERRRLYVCIASCETESRIDEKVIEQIENKLFQQLKIENTSLESNLIKIIQKSIDMTKYNREINLKNVGTYKNRITEEEELSVQNFNFDKFESLKLDLRTVHRNELLVLYKGDDFFKYQERCCDQLLVDIVKNLVSFKEAAN